MKPLTVLEIDALVEMLKTLIGAQVQEIKLAGDALVLGVFTTATGKAWLVIDMNAHAPAIVFAKALSYALGKATKPIVLFLRAHLQGQRLVHVERDVTYGRVVSLQFEGFDGAECELNVRLFPHGQNVIVSAGQKKMAWAKPRDLQPLLETTEASDDPQARSVAEIFKQWQERGSQKPSINTKVDSPKNLEALRHQKIKKLEKAIGRVEQGLTEKQETPWREVGEWVKVHQSLNVPEAWSGYIDPNMSLAENIEHCFERAKKNERKQGGQEQRLWSLREELETWKTATSDQIKKLAQVGSALQTGTNLLRAAQTKGRTRTFDENFEAYSGRSGPENLKLLRAARAWDLWFHVKDIPGRHGILRRNKSQKVPEKVLNEVAHWLLELQFQEKTDLYRGQTFAVVVTERRYVTPIKGEKAGRVTYRNERTLQIKL